MFPHPIIPSRIATDPYMCFRDYAAFAWRNKYQLMNLFVALNATKRFK
ncbi:hypothetical protein RB2150_09669 [Rhodobacterales bacterium HTCC2150]|nr:hypothetical protein RB2150_09669 [Rhodobacterales bacterium HTCC2150] [Rhodobacteraceae bacterium HTCC2150]